MKREGERERVSEKREREREREEGGKREVRSMICTNCYLQEGCDEQLACTNSVSFILTCLRLPKVRRRKSNEGRERKEKGKE